MKEKQTKRQQKKREEERIIAEMDAAMQEQKAEEQARKEQSTRQRASQTVRYCSRCKAETTGGVCQNCGYKEYIPMSEEQRKKIKNVLTIVLLGVFLVLFIVLQFLKS